MNVPGLPRYVRQYKQFRDQELNLVFTYPMLIDQSLQGYADKIRDFFAVSFLNQIRTSNYLHIVSVVTKDLSSSNVDNQALMLYKTLNQNDISSLANFSYYDTQLSISKAIDIQNYINRNLEFLKKQLSSNLLFARLKPSFTTIAIDTKAGLVTIPMIVGTYPFYPNLNATYYIMLIALAYGIKLNHPSRIEVIEKLIDSISPTNYYFYLFDPQGRKQLLINAGLDEKDIEQVIPVKYTPLLPEKAEPKLTDLFLEIGKRIIINHPMVTNMLNKIGLTKDSLDNPRKLLSSIKEKLIDFIVNYVNSKSTHLTISKEDIEKLINKIKDANDILIYSGVGRKYLSIYYLSQLSTLIRDDIKISIQFWKNALDRNKWDRYVGVDSTDPGEVFSHTFARVSAEANEIASKIHLVFQMYFTTNITSIITLAIHLLESEKLPIDLRKEIDNFISEMLSLVAQKNSLVCAALYDYFTQKFSTVTILPTDEKELDKFFGGIENINKSIVLVADTTFKDELSKLNINYFNFSKFSQEPYYFVEELNKVLGDVSNKAQSQAVGIESQLKNLFKEKEGGDVLAKILEIKNDILELCVHFINEVTPTKPSPGRFSNLAKNETEEAKIFRELKTLFQLCIGNLCYTFYLISLVSYITEIVKLIKFNYRVVLRDATDFPNYCVVLPMYVLRNFFEIKIAELFKKTAGYISPADALTPEDEPLRTAQREPKKIVEYIANYLDIPNIIVIDEKANQIHYKFMFMSKAHTLSLNTIDEYIKNQKDILSL